MLLHTTHWEVFAGSPWKSGTQNAELLAATSSLVLNVPKLFIVKEKFHVIKCCNLHSVYKQSAKDQSLQEMLVGWMNG